MKIDHFFDTFFKKLVFIGIFMNPSPLLSPFPDLQLKIRLFIREDTWAKSIAFPEDYMWIWDFQA